MDDDVPLYSTRPEWSDITPLEQYENLNPIAPIAYTEECESLCLSKRKNVLCKFILHDPLSDKDASGYFRAIIKKGEKSERVLDLTETVIRLNPAHYSAWCVFPTALLQPPPSLFLTPLKFLGNTAMKPLLLCSSPTQTQNLLNRLHLTH